VKRFATTLLVAGLMATPMLALPPGAQAAINIGIGISVGVPPPVLPVYAQPVAPGPGYIWTPGYWAWDPSFNDYYWVPGTWVMPPEIGLLWTPGWWGWSDGYYRWHAGYWSPRVGFYGGVNYGYGYFGNGYSGGEWRGRDFYYNRAVNNINGTNIRNLYVNKTVINNVSVNRISYNGGRGGLSAKPTAAQRSYANQRRFQPTTVQAQQREKAMHDPAQRFKSNRGRPAVFATQHAGRFEGPHSVTRPAAPRTRMVATPQRAQHAGTPNRNSRGVVEAPNRNREAPNRGRATLQAPRHERGTREAPTRSNRGTVQAPHQRTQPAVSHEQPRPQSIRNEHAQPPAPREQPRPQAPRGERAASREHGQAQPERRHRPPPSSSHDGHH
jgi:hypothetical protein